MSQYFPFSIFSILSLTFTALVMWWIMNEYSDTHYIWYPPSFQFIINDEFKSLIPSVKHTFSDSIFNIRQTKLCIIYLINVVHSCVVWVCFFTRFWSTVKKKQWGRWSRQRYQLQSLTLFWLAIFCDYLLQFIHSEFHSLIMQWNFEPDTFKMCWKWQSNRQNCALNSLSHLEWCTWH